MNVQKSKNLSLFRVAILGFATTSLAACSGMSALQSGDGNGIRNSIFASGSVNGSGTAGSGSVTGSGGTSSGGGSISGSSRTCTAANNADLQALQNAIQAANSPSSSLKGCQATLGENFAASATDSGGHVTNVTTMASSATAIGVKGTGASVEINKFEVDGLRPGNGKAIVTTDVCSASSTLPCSPSSSGFILEIHWNSNGSVAGILLPNAGSVTSADLACGPGTELLSPLVIEDNPGQGIETLDPYSTSTYFDLTGDGNPSRISCVRQGAFLALPDSEGKIVNINQLFGNNTVGPDGRKAANGFLALGKYDSNFDGVIDAKDPVFNRLVLWEDDNCDGIAQPWEYRTLGSRGIVGIPWANDIPMFQLDIWGNATEERSLVESDFGWDQRVFDLWFKPY